MDMIAFHGCLILFLRAKSLGPAKTQGKWFTQGSAYKEVGTMGEGRVFLEIAYHIIIQAFPRKY